MAEERMTDGVIHGVFHAAVCNRFHKALFFLVEGFVEVEWLEPCPLLVLDAYARDAGSALAIAIDAGDWGLAEEIASALDVNDPEGPQT